MRVLILGASGRTGRHVLNETLKLGYDVNALVRKPDSIKQTNSKLSVYTGNPLNKIELENALKDCSIVINILNISRKSDFPWSKLRTSSTFLSDVTKNIIDLSKLRSLESIIVCTAWGVNETLKDIPFWFRWIIKNSNIGVAYKDHERQENLLTGSNVNWTIVRSVGLTNSLLDENIIESHGNLPRPKLTISRSSLAKYMVNAIGNSELRNKAVVISESKI